MSLTEKDSQYLWHPYTQHKTASAPIAITKGKGALLWDENGKEYIDVKNTKASEICLAYFAAFALYFARPTSSSHVNDPTNHRLFVFDCRLIMTSKF